MNPLCFFYNLAMSSIILPQFTAALSCTWMFCVQWAYDMKGWTNCFIMVQYKILFLGAVPFQLPDELFEQFKESGMTEERLWEEYGIKVTEGMEDLNEAMELTA